LIAASKKKIVGNYHHPLWMYVAGWLVVLLMSWMGFATIRNSLLQLF
jgi:Mn2+/Fe2+ NRAMP family transporter